jgi:hypothetical protein
MGVSLSMKNLFGTTPTAIYGSPRRYLHAPIRLPRVLVDLVQLLQPVFSVVDALVAEDQRELFGAGSEVGALIMGTDPVATDATASRLLGIDPESDFPAHPFHFDRNHVLLAAQSGLGRIAEADIEVVGDFGPGRRSLTVDRQAADTDQLTRRAIASEVPTFLRLRQQLLQSDAGRYVALGGGRVLAVADTVDNLGKWAALTGRTADVPGILVKKIVPSDVEDERLDVYDTV